MSLDELLRGDIVLVRPGARVPADGQIVGYNVLAIPLAAGVLASGESPCRRRSERS